MINKILIANRGEIAVRIIRTCKEMGIKTIAVYSDADRSSLHVILADEAYHIGKSPVNESYLNIRKILSVIKQSKPDAVHPGYGFLSENYEFAKSITDMGLKWIGAPSDAIRLMGDKIKAREFAKKNFIPLIPGIEDKFKNLKDITKSANRIGYPLLIKAASGGGGIGMRIVNKEADLQNSFNLAKSEAKRSFLDSRVYIEKYLEEPHHIEIQIASDFHGNHLSLGERECSIQRRYQKLIEECPSPFIDNELREKLKNEAIKLIKACNYIGVGTVEFLVDKHKNWYFLEMNTRLQVEHPITELVYRVDLVKTQIQIASGTNIRKILKNKTQIGHSIECRIYAENGYKNFQPSTGTIIDYFPPSGPGIRFDEGFIRGQEISPFYDPMLGKLIVYAENRDEAIAKLIRALGELKIVGLITSAKFCIEILNHDKFKSGHYCTHTLEQILPEIIKSQSKKIKLSNVILAHDRYKAKTGKIKTDKSDSNWIISS